MGSDLGFFHSRGERGVAVDLAEGVRLYALAACFCTVQPWCLLRYGTGVYRRILQRRSACLFPPLVSSMLGVLYMNGWGIPPDLRAAAVWFTRAAERGTEQARQALRGLAAAGIPEAVVAVQRLGL